MTTVDPAAVLALPMQKNDADAATVRDYLVSLVREVWKEGECFSGKRPFGNSGWDWDLYEPLGTAGLVVMTFDEDGCIDQFTDEERDKANAFILAAIDHLGVTP